MQKVQLHIRQNLLQQLWDKYVPASSPEYKNIELVYLKGGPEEMEKQPEQIQLLLQLVLKNKMLQLNLVQHPAVMKSGQRQMEHSLRRMERYYAVQLKSADPAMYRTVRRYFTLLEQVREDDRRYQTWQKTNLAIEKQKEEYRLLSLFSERLQERLEAHSISTLRTLERDFVDSLTETEYQMLAAELIWQEKPELIAHFSGWDESQCENVITELEKHIEQNADSNMRQMLSQVPNQSMKEKLITAAERLGQREFCLFYHQVTNLEDIAPQFALWKESRTEMRSLIDQMESKALRRVWKQLKQTEHKFGNGMLREHGKDVQSQETLRTQEKELLYSLLETEYQTLAERLIWQEKPDLIAHLRACEKAKCKEMIKKLEKDPHMRQVLSTIQKQSAKKKLISAAYKLEQREFSLFYWQTAELLNANTQLVRWKKSRAEMIRSIEDLDLEDLQQVWEQMQAVEPVQGFKRVFVEKMQHLQNQYRQNTSENLQEQIAALMEENDLTGVADMIDLEQLMQDHDRAEYTENPADDTQESGFGEHEQLVLWDGAYHVIQNLEHEREIRGESIEQQQMQAAKAYQEVYHQIFGAEKSMMQYQENTQRDAERIFRKQHQERLTEEEIQNICEWSQAFLEVYFAQQGRAVNDKAFSEEDSFSSDRSDQIEQLEMIHLIKKLDQYMTDHDIEEQYGTGERLILRRQEELSKDERIQKLLIYIRELDEQQKDRLIHALADMVQMSVRLSFQKMGNTNLAELPMQSDQQKSVEGLLRTEDMEFARKLLRLEDREFAQKLLWLEDREFAERLLQIEDTEFASQLLQDSSRQLLDVSYRSLWEWGETLLFHPEHGQEQEDADVLSFSQQEMFSSDTNEAQQADVQTQVIRRQIEMAKDRNRLQSLIRQINHQVDIQLVYTDAQLRLPQIQALLQYVQQLDERQYGVLVKQLAQIAKLQKLSYDEPKAPAVAAQTADEGERHGIEDKKFIEKLLQVEDRELAERLLRVEDRKFVEKLLRDNGGQSQEVSYGSFVKELAQVMMAQKLSYDNTESLPTSYQTLVQSIQNYEKQRQLVLYREIREIEQKILPQAYRKEGSAINANDLTPYEISGNIYDLMPNEEAEKEIAFYDRNHQESSYQPRELEYSTQTASVSEEDQQRKELRMQQETARLKSVQEQLDKKLKDVEQQLKKVEDSTKVKEDVKTFAEQVKRQLYEELHVEKLRRGLI